VRAVVGRGRLADVAGARAPEPEAGKARRHVLDPDRAVVRRVTVDPGEVVRPEGGARDDAEAVFAEARDREVALDPAALVEHRRVRDPADLARDVVVAEALEEGGGALADDVDLREAGLVEERGGLARGAVLGTDRGRPE